MGVGGLSADEIRLAIVLLAETKGAVQNIKLLENELKETEALARLTKKSLTGLYNNGLISQKQFEDGVKKANKTLGEVEPNANKATKGLWNLNNVARTALGTFEAMAIFFITRFIGQAITKTIDSLKQLELSFYKISIAEASLSKSGVDIVPQDLLDIVDEINKTFTFVSKIDATKIVGQVALLTKDLKLTKEQIRDLAVAIPALARSTGESIEETTAAIATGIAKNGKGLADQNVQVNAQIIAQRAVKLGLAESEDAYNKLSAEQKQYINVAALVTLITDASNEAIQKQGELSESVTDKTGKLTATWEDFLTKTGVDFAPFIKGGLDLIINSLIGLQKGLRVYNEFFKIWVAAGVAGWITLRDVATLSVRGIGNVVADYAKNFKIARDIVNETFAPPKLASDTPTGIPTPPDTPDAEQKVEDLKGALEKANDEILKGQLKLEQDLTDVAIDLGRKMVDIGTEYAKKRADAESDYNEKVYGINQDYNNKIDSINQKSAESKAKFHSDQLQKEKEFQNSLKEMQEKFLMDLDDALHARDARQILKLIRQYELDKLQAERKHALDQDNAKKEEALRQKSYAAERKQAEKEKKQKLADAQHDYQLKLAKLKADEDAEVKAAVLAANRKTQDLIKANQDRLAIIAADLVNQYNLTKAGLDAVLELYKRYYGDGGYISQVMAGMQVTLANQSTPSQVTSTARSGGRSTSSPQTRSGGRPSKMAEGGTIIANQPTTVTFGERGLEQASFMPIGRTGMDVNKIFSSLGGEGGSSMGGMVTIALDLSPDLEHRIISNTMSRTAQVITKTRRTK